jgi:hypothetical protein
MMSSLTTRLNLLKAAGTDLVNVATQIDNAFDILDDVVGIFRCTAATHPVTNLVDGRMIYETDTNKFLRYDAVLVSWVNILPKLSHAEFTAAIVGAVNGTHYTQIGIPVAVAAPATNDSTFVVVAGNTLVIAQPGLYSVIAKITWPNPTIAGRSYIGIVGVPMIAEAQISPGNYGTSVAYPNLRTTTPNEVVSFYCMQTTGGNQNTTSTIAITRIS